MVTEGDAEIAGEENTDSFSALRIFLFVITFVLCVVVLVSSCLRSSENLVEPVLSRGDMIAL